MIGGALQNCTLKDMHCSLSKKSVLKITPTRSFYEDQKM